MTYTHAMPRPRTGRPGAVWWVAGAAALLLAGLGAFLVHPVLGIAVLALLGAPVLVMAPHWALLLLVAALPFDAVASIDGEGASLTRLLGLAVLGGWVAHVLLEGRPVRLGRAGWLLVAYAGFAALSLAWAADVAVTMRALVTLLQLLLLYVMVSNALRTPRDVARALDVLLASTTVLAVLVIAGGTAAQGRAEFTFGDNRLNPNYLAAALVFPAVAAVGLGRSRGLFGRWRLLAVVPIVLALVLTGSRGGGVALASGLLVMAWLRPRLAATLAAGALVMALVTPMAVPAHTLERFWSRFAAADQDRLSGRMDIWRVALAMAGDQPLHGMAYGGFREAFYRYMLETSVDPYFAREHSRGNRAAHSIYVGTLAELGVVGVGLLGVGLAVHGLGLLRVHARAAAARHLPAAAAATALLGVFASFLLFGASIDLMGAKNAWVLLAMMHALVVQCRAPERVRA